MPTPELSRTAPALLVWKTQLKSTDGQILQVQFGLFPICREGEWNWTRLLVVCTPYLAMYVSTSVPQAFQAISINLFVATQDGSTDKSSRTLQSFEALDIGESVLSDSSETLQFRQAFSGCTTQVDVARRNEMDLCVRKGCVYLWGHVNNVPYV